MNRFGFVLAAMVALPPLAHAIPAQSSPAQTVSACAAAGDVLVPPLSWSWVGVPVQQLRCRTGSLGRLEEGPSPLVSSHGFRLEQDQLIETVRLGGSRGASARYATRRYLPVTADNPKKER